MIKTTKKAVEHQKKVLSQLHTQTIKEEEQKNTKLFKPKIDPKSSQIVLNKKSVSPPIFRGKMTLDNSNNGKDGESRTIDSWRGVFDHLQNDMVMRVEKKKTLEETIKKEIEEQ
jgi:hypothetical protein